MAKPRVSAGGGLAAILYVLKKGREVGGVLRLYRRLRSKNTCRTCALGMGGQRGGMVNEAGQFPEVCKKSMQALAADMQPPINEEVFSATGFKDLATYSSRQLEGLGRLTTPLYAGPQSSHFEPISWDEALERVGAKLRETAPD